jgi:hypothetical protein
MRQTLLFLAGVVFLLSLVPLSIWAATGRIKDAWLALKGYMTGLAPVYIGIAIGLLAGLIANFTG